MKIFRIFCRRHVWYWLGTGPWASRAVGPYQTRLDALLAGPDPIPNYWARLSKERIRQRSVSTAVTERSRALTGLP